MSLSTAEEYYIKNHLEKSAEQLAKDIGCAPKIVKSFIEKVKADAPVVAEINKPIYDQERGITVLTEAASTYADEVTQKAAPFDYVKENADKIFKIRKNEPAK